MTLLLKELKNIDLKILNEKEVTKCIETFNAYDKNGSKRLEKEELRMVLQEMEQHPSEEQLIRMINEVDSTGEGAIIQEDFLKIVALQKLCQDNEDQFHSVMTFNALGGKMPVVQDNNNNKDKVRRLRFQDYSDKKITQDDCSQSIYKADLINVIKNEFDLDIDVNWLNKELDLSSNDQIDFSDLKNILTGW